MKKWLKEREKAIQKETKRFQETGQIKFQVKELGVSGTLELTPSPGSSSGSLVTNDKSALDITSPTSLGSVVINSNSAQVITYPTGSGSLVINNNTTTPYITYPNNSGSVVINSNSALEITSPTSPESLVINSNSAQEITPFNSNSNSSSTMSNEGYIPTPLLINDANKTVETTSSSAQEQDSLLPKAKGKEELKETEDTKNNSNTPEAEASGITWNDLINNLNSWGINTSDITDVNSLVSELMNQKPSIDLDNILSLISATNNYTKLNKAIANILLGNENATYNEEAKTSEITWDDLINNLNSWGINTSDITDTNSLGSALVNQSSKIDWDNILSLISAMNNYTRLNNALENLLIGDQHEIGNQHEVFDEGVDLFHSSDLSTGL